MTKIKSVLLLATLTISLSLHFAAAQARDIQTAVFAGGCYWCVEADFDKVNGVVETISGFMGGTVVNPTYKQVTKGGTGHFEAVKIKFDADIVSYRELVDIFWRTVDPTDAGGQFCDRGDSYRTAVFVRGAAQKQAATASRAAADAAISGSIVTKIIAAGPFYRTKASHQNYYLGSKKVVTRYGFISQAKAYKKYRKGCGRDQRVRQIWGSAAPFAGL